jgi:CDP-glycerol glycerophosphotransferase
MRAHYFHDEDDETPLALLVESGRVRDVSLYPSTNELCIASDALITDYSSVMFDYALLDQPIAVYAYDYETYRRTRGVNFDLLDEPPGFVATTPGELLEGFRSGEVWGEQAAKARAEFRRKFCEFDDGRASERVVRRVLLGEKVTPADEARSTGASEQLHAADERVPEPGSVEPVAAPSDGGSADAAG